jgi:hypothetical protein
MDAAVARYACLFVVRERRDWRKKKRAIEGALVEKGATSKPLVPVPV